MQKLSEIVRNIKYKQTRCTLYEKDYTDGKCQVCALGGIALSVPERYFVNEDKEIIGDKQRNNSSPIYDDILSAAGVPEDKIASNYEHEAPHYPSLGAMIVSLNDNRSKTFAEIADILESKGL